MNSADDSICQIGRMAVHLRESLPPMRMSVEEEPGYPDARRAVMSSVTWETLEGDDAAGDLFWSTLLGYPLGLTHLFGEVYRVAASRYAGDLPSHGWQAELEAEIDSLF